MNFTDFVKTVADSGASYDEQEGILKIYFELRDSAKKDYNEAVAKLHEVRSYYASKTDDLERETSYLRRQLDDAYGYGQAMRVSCVNSEKRVAELERENEQLKAALAEARAALPTVVKVAIGEICRMVVELRDRKVDCIKQIRSAEHLVNDGSGGPIALRLAKDIFELVGAAEGVSCSVPSRINSGYYIDGSSSYYKLKREVEALIKGYYPSYKVELSD